jgi:hypothetical protein
MFELSQRARGLAAAALIVLLAGLAPRAALGACGDYVIFTGAGMNHPLAAGGHALADQGGLSTENLPAFPLPCRGPRCSGQPTSPPAPPAPVQIHSRSDTPALPAGSAAALARERSSWVVEDISLEPLEVISSIFHPPRHST